MKKALRLSPIFCSPLARAQTSSLISPLQSQARFKFRQRYRVGEERQRATFVPFAEVGAEGNPYRIWLRKAGSPRPERFSLLAWGVESRSRAGNVNGSILDETSFSYVVTFDGQRQAEDWFAVRLAKPVTIRRVVYLHGRTFHDGGWFDASKGKPRIQVLRTPNGDWESVGTLDTYPETTATDSRQIRPGEPFFLYLKSPLKVYGVRVIGTPAQGDNPAQNFSSCGDLQAYAE